MLVIHPFAMVEKEGFDQGKSGNVIDINNFSSLQILCDHLNDQTLSRSIRNSEVKIFE